MRCDTSRRSWETINPSRWENCMTMICSGCDSPIVSARCRCNFDLVLGGSGSRRPGRLIGPRCAWKCLICSPFTVGLGLHSNASFKTSLALTWRVKKGGHAWKREAETNCSLSPKLLLRVCAFLAHTLSPGGLEIDTHPQRHSSDSCSHWPDYSRGRSHLVRRCFSSSSSYFDRYEYRPAYCSLFSP